MNPLLDQPACRADEAERCLLGQCMTWPRPCLDVAANFITPDDFHEPTYQRLFAALWALDDETGGRFDVVAVEAVLKREGALEGIGGRAALVALSEEATTPETAELHAKAVREAAVGRALQNLGRDILRASGAPDFSASALLPDLLARLHALGNGRVRGGQALLTRRAADIEPESIEWIWLSRIPKGKLTILLGDPGQGKSLLSLAVAAAVTHGRGWPDARDFRAKPGAVLLASAEDDAADTIRPRAEAAGVDLARLHIIEGVGNERTRHVLDLGAHLDALRERIEDAPDVRLLILDPLAAFMLGPDSHKACEVRAALAPLAALAQETGVAVLAVHHMRKSPGQAIHRGLGSVAFSAAARSVLGVGADPSNPTGGRRLLVPVKGNLSAPAPVLAFSIRTDSKGVPAIEWEAGPVKDVDADAVLGGFTDGQPGPDAAAQAEAVDFLLQTLADGPRSAKDVLREAEDSGIAKRTLERAKKTVGVTPFKPKGTRDAAWQWQLSEAQTP